MTFAATLTTEKVANTISDGPTGVFMHGPTFMANPLACSVANASINLLLSQNWQEKIISIEKWFNLYLESAREIEDVKEVRILGAIAVLEMRYSINVPLIQKEFVKKGIWIRPFGKLVYIMPPYIITKEQVSVLCNVILNIIKKRRYSIN